MIEEKLESLIERYTIEIEDEIKNLKKYKDKSTKRKNTIYYENGEKIQQYKFKSADEKVVSEV